MECEETRQFSKLVGILLKIQSFVSILFFVSFEDTGFKSASLPRDLKYKKLFIFAKRHLICPFMPGLFPFSFCSQHVIHYCLLLGLSSSCMIGNHNSYSFT